MTIRQFTSLILLGIIWGASFMFIKLTTPVLGPIYGASFRLLSAALFLILYFTIKREKVDWRKNWFWFAVIGLTNSAFPFTLFAVASLYIPANLSAIFNSTSPIFGLIYGVLLIHEKVTVQKVFGLILGTLGVMLVSYQGLVTGDAFGFLIGMLSCMGAASFYGLSGSLIKKYTLNIPSTHMVLGTMVMGGLLILPFGVLSPMRAPIDILTVIYMLIFGIVGTAIAYIIYFRLLKEVGPMKALMVTYLAPVFGIFWSMIFLNEVIALDTVLGLGVIFVGIYFINLNVKTKVVSQTNEEVEAIQKI